MDVIYLNEDSLLIHGHFCRDYCVMATVRLLVDMPTFQVQLFLKYLAVESEKCPNKT